MARFKNANRTGRSTGKAPRFVQLYHWEMNLAAYRALSCYGRALLLEFRKKYDGANNGQIIMSIRQAATLLNCHRDTAVKALQELEDKGWIRATQKGSFKCKIKLATTWRITNQPVGLGVDTPATKEYATWKSEDEI